MDLIKLLDIKLLDISSPKRLKQTLNHLQQTVGEALEKLKNELVVGGGLTEEQAKKLEKIIINGDGKKFLNDKGEYVEIETTEQEFATQEEIKNIIWG